LAILVAPPSSIAKELGAATAKQSEAANMAQQRTLPKLRKLSLEGQTLVPDDATAPLSLLLLLLLLTPEQGSKPFRLSEGSERPFTHPFNKAAETKMDTMNFLLENLMVDG